MNTDKTQDGAEPSPASAGSHVELHRAVRALLEGVNARYAKNPREWTCPHMQALDDMTQSEPQSTLTDEEREALVVLRDGDWERIDRKTYEQITAAISGLLARDGGE